MGNCFGKPPPRTAVGAEPLPVEPLETHNQQAVVVEETTPNTQLAEPSQAPQSMPSSSQPLNIGVSLPFLLRFQEECFTTQGLNKSKLTTLRACENVVKPLTSAQLCSMASLEQFRGLIGPPNVYVVHAWEGLLADALQAMIDHANGREDVYFWFDLVCINQHGLDEQVFEGLPDTLSSIIAQTQQTLVLITAPPKALPMNRLWCLWEIFLSCTPNAPLPVSIQPPPTIYHSQRDHISYNFTLPPHSIVDRTTEIVLSPSNVQHLKEAMLNDFLGTSKMFTDAQVEHAGTFSEQDSRMISDAICNTSSPHRVNFVLAELFGSWVSKLGEEILDSLQGSSGSSHDGSTSSDSDSMDDNNPKTVRDSPTTPTTQTTTTTPTTPTTSTKGAANTPGANVPSDSTASVRFKVAFGRHLVNSGAVHRGMVLMQENLPELERISGQKSADVASCYMALGKTFMLQRQYSKAVDYYQQALTIRQALFGEKHAETAATLNALGMAHCGSGDNDKALELCRHALEIRKEVLGPNDSNTAMSHNYVGMVLTAMGELSRAAEAHTRALEIQLQTIGPVHLETALSYKNLANTHDALRDYLAAARFHQEALNIHVTIMGETHADTIDAMLALGLSYRRNFSWESAVMWYHRALQAWTARSSLNPEHANDTKSAWTGINLYSEMGFVLKTMAQFERALDCHEQALRLTKRVFGDHHVATATCLNNIGETMLAHNRYDEALARHQQALQILMDLLGPLHPDTARTHELIGCVYFALNNFDEALRSHQTALDTRISNFGKIHPETALSYAHLGLVLACLGKFTPALKYEQRALDTKLAEFTCHPPPTTTASLSTATGSSPTIPASPSISSARTAGSSGSAGNKTLTSVDGDLETATCLYNLGLIFCKQQKHHKAIPYVRKAIEVSTRVLGPRHPTTMTYQDVLRDAQQHAYAVAAPKSSVKQSKKKT